MNRKKISHLALALVLVCSAWLPAAIDFSKGRLGAVTEEQTVETKEELQESEEVPIVDVTEEQTVEIVETKEDLQESEEAPILDGNSENLSIEQLDQSFIFEDEVNSSSRSSVIVATEASFIAAWNNEDVSEITLSSNLNISNVGLLAERTSDLTISSDAVQLNFSGLQLGIAPKWKDSTLTILNTSVIINGILDIPEGNLHYIVNNGRALVDTFFVLNSTLLTNAPEGKYGRIRNLVVDSDTPKNDNVNFVHTRVVLGFPITILENLTLRGGGISSQINSDFNPRGSEASITVLGTTTFFDNARMTNSVDGSFRGEPFPVLSTSRLFRPVDEPLGIWTSKPKDRNKFLTEPDRSWRNANFIMEDGVIIESSNNSITDENFKLSEIWFIDSVSSDLWVPPSIDEIELTVRYVNENSGEEISHSDISFHGIGSKVELDDRGNDLFEDGYDFSEVSIDPKTIDFNPDTKTITIPDEDVTVTFYYKKAQGEVTVNYQDINGFEIRIPDRIEGDVFSQYEVNHPDITGYAFHGLREDSAPVNGIFKREVQNIIFIYTVGDPGIVSPVDPLNPDITVDPDNKPEIPEDQGLLSIDFVSQFDFGTSYISASSQTYHAKSQRLLNEDGSVNLVEERPNYVQISDRRLTGDRVGWELSVTQVSQFMNSKEEELRGAQLKLENQQLVTTQGGTAPEIVRGDGLNLIPGSRQNLLLSKGDEGTGTWVYRFGDANTGAESVKLEVPEGANPSATTYRTTLIWEISAIPQN